MGSNAPEPARTVYRGWDAYLLRQGRLELILVPEVGGRVMGLRWVGEDLLFTHPELEGRVDDLAAVADLAAYRREVGFPLWGGEKTWLAPQDHWVGGVPFPDLDSAAYRLEAIPGAVRLTSPVCRETGMEIERTITLGHGEGEWRVTHALRNAGARLSVWALWDVIMVRRPARVFLPRAADSAFPGGVKNFADEGQLCTPHACSLDSMGSVVAIRCDEPRAFKAGVDAAEGWMLAVLETGAGLLGYRISIAGAGPPYPHGCALEVYNSPRYPYFEMEVLGPLVSLAPGARHTLEQRHAIFPLIEEPATELAVRAVTAGVDSLPGG